MHSVLRNLKDLNQDAISKGGQTAGGCSPLETRAGAVGGTVVVVEIRRRNAREYAILENASTFVSLGQ